MDDAVLRIRLEEDQPEPQSVPQPAEPATPPAPTTQSAARSPLPTTVHSHPPQTNSPPVTPTAVQPPTPAAAPPPAVPQATAPTPVPDQAKILDEAKIALQGLGEKNADNLIEALETTGQIFADVGQAIAAAYRKGPAPAVPPQPAGVAPQPAAQPQPPSAAPQPQPVAQPAAAPPKAAPAQPAPTAPAQPKTQQPQPATAPFDYRAAALKMRQEAQHRNRLKAEYENLDGPGIAQPAEKPQPKTLDILADAASQIRGLLGSTFGPIVGAGLDIYAALKKRQAALDDAALKNLQQKAAQPPTPIQPAPVPPTPAAAAPVQPQPVAPTPAPAPPQPQAPTPPTPQSAAPPTPAAPQPPAPPMAAPQPTPAAAPTPVQPAPVQPAAAAPPVPKPAPAKAPTPAMTGAPAEGAEAGAAMGAAEGLAAAAGPIGIAVAAYVAVVQGLQAATVGAIQAVGGFATAMASPDSNPATGIAYASDAISGFGDKILLISPALGIFASSVGAAGKELSQFMRAMDATAARYGQYSPEISYAQAQADMKRQFGDLRRSQQIAPNTAAYIKQESRLEQSWEDFKVKVLDEFLPYVTVALKGIEDVLNVISAGWDIAKWTTPLGLMANVGSKILEKMTDDNSKDIQDSLDPTKFLLDRNAGTGKEPAFIDEQVG